MAATAIDFNKKSLVIITGASQGIGQKIAEIIGNKLKNDSKIILLARSERGLTDARNRILSTNNKISIRTYSTDLSKPDITYFEEIFDDNLSDGDSYENAIIFHNAGCVGSLVSTVELNDLNTWRNYYDLNLFSAALLNSVFITKCKKYIPNLYVINISSLCGHKPFINLALYGSAKAARDLYFSVLSVEEPKIIVLKYSPGPVVTAMFNEIIETAQNPELKTQFKDMKENKVALTTDQTVEKLFGILESGKYKSGDRIDYFDV